MQMRHLPTNGGGPALTALLGNNSQVLVLVDRGGQRANARPARCARWPASAPARAGPARRADHEGARLQHRVLAVGRHVRAQGHARRRRHHAARGSRRRRLPTRSSPRPWRTSARTWPISTSRSSAVLGRGRQARRGCGALDRQGVRYRRSPPAARIEGSREPAQGPCRRRRIRRRRRARAGGERRPAVRHAGVARRRHAADARRRPDDGVRRCPARCAPATARRSRTSPGATCRTRCASSPSRRRPRALHRSGSSSPCRCCCSR